MWTMPVTWSAIAGTSSAGAAGLLLVVNKGDRTLGIHQPDTGKQIASVELDAVTGHEVAASPDGRLAFVPIFGDSGVGAPGMDGRLIRVVDVAAARVIDTIDLGQGLRPHEAVFGPTDGLLYVTTEVNNTVTVIDPQKREVIGSVPTGQEHSHMLVISSDGKRGYTSNVGPGSVSVLDLEHRKLVAVVPIGGPSQRIAISADDQLVFTADQRNPRLVVIDTADNKVAGEIGLPGIGYGSTPTRDGKWLVIALPGVRKVAAIDLGTRKVAKTWDVPTAPQEVLIRPDGREAYVSCDRAGKIAVIDLQDWTVSRLFAAGSGADGLAWAATPSHERRQPLDD